MLQLEPNAILRVLRALRGEFSLASVPCEPKLEVTTHSKRQGTKKRLYHKPVHARGEHPLLDDLHAVTLGTKCTFLSLTTEKLTLVRFRGMLSERLPSFCLTKRWNKVLGKKGDIATIVSRVRRIPHQPFLTHRSTCLNDKEVVEHTYSGRVAGAVTARSDGGTRAQGVTKKSRNKI